MPRFAALWLILSLSLPPSAFALRQINAGQEEGTIDDDLLRAFAGAEELGPQQSKSYSANRDLVLNLGGLARVIAMRVGDGLVVKLDDQEAGVPGAAREMSVALGKPVMVGRQSESGKVQEPGKLIVVPFVLAAVSRNQAQVTLRKDAQGHFWFDVENLSRSVSMQVQETEVPQSLVETATWKQIRDDLIQNAAQDGTSLIHVQDALKDFLGLPEPPNEVGLVRIYDREATTLVRAALSRTQDQKALANWLLGADRLKIDAGLQRQQEIGELIIDMQEFVSRLEEDRPENDLGFLTHPELASRDLEILYWRYHTREALRDASSKQRPELQTLFDRLTVLKKATEEADEQNWGELFFPHNNRLYGRLIGAVASVLTAKFDRDFALSLLLDEINWHPDPAEVRIFLAGADAFMHSEAWQSFKQEYGKRYEQQKGRGVLPPKYELAYGQLTNDPNNMERMRRFASQVGKGDVLRMPVSSGSGEQQVQIEEINLGMVRYSDASGKKGEIRRKDLEAAIYSGTVRFEHVGLPPAAGAERIEKEIREAEESAWKRLAKVGSLEMIRDNLSLLDLARALGFAEVFWGPGDSVGPMVTVTEEGYADILRLRASLLAKRKRLDGWSTPEEVLRIEQLAWFESPEIQGPGIYIFPKQIPHTKSKYGVQVIKSSLFHELIEQELGRRKVQNSLAAFREHLDFSVIEAELKVAALLGEEEFFQAVQNRENELKDISSGHRAHLNEAKLYAERIKAILGNRIPST